MTDELADLASTDGSFPSQAPGLCQELVQWLLYVPLFKAFSTVLERRMLHYSNHPKC